jgi:hypothetical protein
MAVYSLSHGRSRELYDLTMLEVTRVLYNDLLPKSSDCTWSVARNARNVDDALRAFARFGRVHQVRRPDAQS